jgi:hypothetical protein
MFTIQISDSSLPRSIRKIHKKKVTEWKQSGAKGLKPKLYESSELIIKTGLVHINAVPVQESVNP